MSEDQHDSTTLLNVNQRSGLAMTLSVLEEMLYEIELNISCCPCRWVMFEMNDDVPTPIKREIVNKIALIRGRIGIIMEEFSLKKRIKSAGGDVMGKLSYAWQILEGTKARHLRGYGAVAEGLAERLDPQLNTIIVLVDEIRHLISKKEYVPEGDPHT
jgi:hypothetical protein